MTNDMTTMIIAYETGELGYEDTLDMFQRLLDTGLVWNLQGHYGRAAEALLEQGLINNK